MKLVRKPATSSLLAASTIMVMCVSLAACGSSSNGGGGSSDPGKTDTITVGVLPITSVAALRLGVEKGFFKEQHIEVKTAVAQSGAALVPAIVSGQYQFGFSNNMSLILAYGKGLPVRILRMANSADSDPTPSQEALVAAKDSSINSVKDLAGKTIAVNSLNNTPQLSVMVTLQKAGVDPKSVKFVEVGFPDMPLALEQGRVDAADISEPFLQVALKAGDKDLAHPYREVEQNQPLSSWFATKPYIDGHKDLVKRFAAAVDKSNAYATKHPDEIRDFVPTYLKIEKQTAENMALPGFPEGAPTPSFLKLLADYAKQFGMIQSVPKNLDGLVANVE